jgi:acetolactate synthase-1/2/3 large subunit
LSENTNSTKVTDYIAARLHAHSVKQVFELSGGMITHLLDSLHVQGKIHVVSVHHEQTAAFAADAAGRMTGVPGVAMATSGPGATNLLTGMGSCYFDSSPAVFITGQVNRNEQKGDRQIRQLGFQETDIVTMAAPITKWAVRIQEPGEIPAALDRAFRVAIEGRPGPVLLDIPMDIQRSMIDASADAPIPSAADGGPGAVLDYQPLLDALAAAKRPMILLGGGVTAGRATTAIRRLAEALGIPVVFSLMGCDVMPSADPRRVGMIGTYGNRWANLALMRSDVLLVAGSRLDVRQTGSRTDLFEEGRRIFHVDCEPGEINNRIKNCVPMLSEIGPFAEGFPVTAYRRSEGLPAWLAEIEELRAAWPDDAELPGVPGINPNAFMHQLSRLSGAAAAYVVDVGQHQMWAAQSVELGADQRFLTSGGMGSMGFALPASIGAALSAPGRPVVVIAGDGGFQCNIQELQTIVRLGLPVKIVVVNNHCHGMVRQFQESYFGARYQSTMWGYSAPDFEKVGLAYGIESRTVEATEGVADALAWLWEKPEQPQLLQVMVEAMANSYPKVAFGRGISEMEPFAKPIEMEST